VCENERKWNTKSVVSGFVEYGYGGCIKRLCTIGEREYKRGSGILILYERCCMFYDTATNNLLRKFGFFFFFFMNILFYIFLIISFFVNFFKFLFKIFFTKKKKS
jgi:hypothetical protein